ncbi:hypothetical protein Daus18300_010053 [Diaporthe australafricana]|uniref:Uncharacterized protein n=1 Tax=Diaporthe australafricana TaxID=127596 RepID=A0ABR3WBZ8_9PEZI
MSVSIPSLENPLAQPKLMSAFRRFGRYDDFKPLSPSTSSIGSKSIGKINIDCQFLFKKSKWGTLEGLPGGIMCLNLNFGPPSGCRVSNATVTITLDEEDPCLRPYTSGRPRQVLHPSRIPVEITEWYGPQTVGGEKKSADHTSTTKAIPEANILGYGVGGVGHERSKNFKKEARWSFNGQLLRGKRTSVYKSLRWDLNENELEGQSFHNPKLRTAFAFEHSGQPFLMKVEIEGKLEKWHHQVKSKLKFDGAREGKVVTLVDFEDHRKFSRGLDRIASGLPWAMEMENLEQIPIEIPDLIRGTTFQQIPAGTPRPLGPPVEPPVVDQAAEDGQQLLGNSRGRPMLQSPNGARPMAGWTTGMRHDERPLPGVEDYRSIIVALSHRPVQHPLGDDPSYIGASNTSTLVNADDATEELSRSQGASAPGTAQTNLAENSQRQIEIVSPQVDRDAMLRILSIPGMLTILQFLASIMGVWGSGTSNDGIKIADAIIQGGARPQDATLRSGAKVESRKARVEEDPEES